MLIRVSMIIDITVMCTYVSTKYVGYGNACEGAALAALALSLAVDRLGRSISVRKYQPQL